MNSTKPLPAFIVGAVHNVNPPVLADGQADSLELDASGNLKVNVVAGGAGSGDVNIKEIGGAAEALNNPLPVELSDGTQSVGTPANPLSVNVISERTPNVFKTVQATASGNTAAWTPASGKKFRLMRFKIQVTGNATRALAGILTVSFQDATSGISLAHDVFVDSLASNSMQGSDSGWIDLGNGYISTTANNVLNVNLSATLTAGNVRVIVVGTEE